MQKSENVVAKAFCVHKIAKSPRAGSATLLEREWVEQVAVRSLLLLLQLFEVEIELCTLKNVAIDATRLAGAG
jgi:hypothetical protein